MQSDTHCVIDMVVDTGYDNSHELRLERERSNQYMMRSMVRRNKYGSIGDMRDRILATLNIQDANE